MTDVPQNCLAEGRTSDVRQVQAAGHETGRTPWTSMLKNSIPRSAKNNRLSTGAKGPSASKSGYVNFLRKTRHFGCVYRQSMHNQPKGIPKTKEYKQCLQEQIA